MKKYAAIVLACAPIFAFAQSANTIQFQGLVSSTTCSATINGSSTSTTILLPTVPTTALAAAGSAAGATGFTVGVAGCEAPVGAPQAIRTTFTVASGASGVTSSGNLKNTSADNGVSLRLMSSPTGSALSLAGGSVAAAGLSLPVGATSTTYDYGVEYYAESGTVTAGAVTGAVQYAIAYP